MAKQSLKKKSLEKAPVARRVNNPFDLLRATRSLARHDPKLNDIRWLIGESLRRVHGRAAGLPASEIALQAREELRAIEEKAGPHA